MAAPQKLADVLSRLIAQRGYARVQGVAAEAEAWAAVAGPAIAKLSRVGELKRSVLEIHVSNNILVSELGYQKAKLLDGLREKLPQHKLKDLRFKVGAIR
ncbi:MAG: DUF721 domain-containing protein [Pirellulales bacterium]